METPTLPSQDPKVDDRHKEIADRRAANVIAYNIPPGVACLENIATPGTGVAAPTLPYMTILAGTHAGMRIHFDAFAKATPKFYDAATYGAPSVPMYLPPAPGQLPDTINQAVAALPKAPITNRDIFIGLGRAETFEQVPLVLLGADRGPYWNDIYGWQRLAGVNPFILSRVRGHLPGNFPVTEDHFTRAFASLRPKGYAGDSLARAIEEGRAFLSDCRALNGVHGEMAGTRQKYIAAPIGLFVRPFNEPASLLPVAIQCGQEPSDAAPIFTPADKFRWRIAQLFLSAAEGSIHEAGEHLAMTHLVVEAFSLAVRRNISSKHPVYVLLQPHFEGTNLINFTARYNLIAKDGTLDRMMAQTIDATRAVAAATIKSVKISEASPMQRLAAHGLDDTHGLPVFPFREDATALWGAVREWVDAYVRLYYADDTAVAADTEIQAFAAELGAQDGCGLNGLPDAKSINGLVGLMTHTIFTGSVHHAAVNFPQYPMMGYIPNMPGAVYAPPPTMATEDSEASLLAALPPLDLTMLQFYSVWQLSAVHNNRLGDYAPFADKRVYGPLEHLNVQLARIGSAIDKRGQQGILPYRYLHPSLIPASITI